MELIKGTPKEIAEYLIALETGLKSHKEEQDKATERNVRRWVEEGINGTFRSIRGKREETRQQLKN